MRRALVGLVLVVGVVALVAVLSSSRGDDKDKAPTYDVMLDNAFGLTKQADFRVAGVKVGSVSDLDVDPKTAAAKVEVRVDRPEFGGLRKDVSCEVRPQSLIGEYFLDCQPGVSPTHLKDADGNDGGTIPLAATSGTIPPDLVMNVLEKPYRERLSILISELGAGFAARGGDVNETIRRAIPALRETDKVLGILSDERQTLAQLTRDSSKTFGNLNGNRVQVQRFVDESKNAAELSARRRVEIAGTIRRLPSFERELRPTLDQLATAARVQTPALRNLRLAAPSLTGLLRQLGPFSDASRPAIRALGRTSVTGIQSVRNVRPTVARLRQLARSAKQPVTNLRFVLKALDNRDKAVEPNPLSPTGKGFTGLEALLQYFFVQSQAINIYDDRGYTLKLGLLINECTQYTDGSDALANPERTKRCTAALGPGGKIEPNPPATAVAASRAKKDGDKDEKDADKPATTSTGQAPSTPAAPSQGGSGGGGTGLPLPQLPPSVSVPGVGTVPLPDLNGNSDDDATQGVLDFLLG